MALDESREGDEIFEENGMQFIMDKKLLEEVKPVRVDYVTSAMGQGFSVKGNLKAGSSCSGSCCSC
jgi:Fe-S cluster assembly iron-binding protein IscA